MTSPFSLPITTPLAYDPATNRILGSNWGYTARGEISLDPTARTFAYDGEGHMKQTTGANGTTVYSYDAQGQRVRKDTPGGSTVYAYDTFGNLGGGIHRGAAGLLPDLLFDRGPASLEVLKPISSPKRS